MNVRDRLEVLRRIPEYQADFQKWRLLCIKLAKKHNKTIDKDLEAVKAHEAKIEEKWKVKPPLPAPPGVRYDGWDEASPRRIPRKLFNDEFAIDVIHPNSGAQETLRRVVKGYDPFWYEFEYKRTITSLDGKRKLEPIDSKKPRKYSAARVLISAPKMKHRGGKHLCMIVDLTRTQAELLREFRDNIKGYQGTLPKEKSRMKPTTRVDIWQVYDMHKEGLEITEIIKKNRLLVDRMIDDKMINNKHQAIYNAIKRAIEKAERMIENGRKITNR